MSGPGFSGRLRMGFGRKQEKQQQTPSPPPVNTVGAPVTQQRPPSYPPPYAGPAAAAPHLQQGRPQSPMPPHGQQGHLPYGPTQIGGGIPPSMPMGQMGQPYGQPPGYPPPMQHRASTGSQQGMMGRPSVSEVEGNNRGKAQLIVGIDFVSELPGNES